MKYFEANIDERAGVNIYELPTKGAAGLNKHRKGKVQPSKGQGAISARIGGRARKMENHPINLISSGSSNNSEHLRKPSPPAAVPNK
mmetsp:Transcript_2278/g.3443  ORF Transcript_2278/g.3443 Transcript_2278/m.3443 type:complete len:87 (+) Transcript_2278:2325-2585(+)